jgi:hypothetical protein
MQLSSKDEPVEYSLHLGEKGYWGSSLNCPRSDMTASPGFQRHWTKRSCRQRSPRSRLWPLVRPLANLIRPYLRSQLPEETESTARHRLRQADYHAGPASDGAHHVCALCQRCQAARARRIQPPGPPCPPAPHELPHPGLPSWHANLLLRPALHLVAVILPARSMPCCLFRSFSNHQSQRLSWS